MTKIYGCDVNLAFSNFEATFLVVAFAVWLWKKVGENTSIRDVFYYHYLAKYERVFWQLCLVKCVAFVMLSYLDLGR